MFPYVFSIDKMLSLLREKYINNSNECTLYSTKKK